ncbi:soleucyl-trna synthetase [Holotrichia oblita]|nr:soleucyl-trna synthetase [Holotrichia oblita]
MDNPYITYDDKYIESVWWSLKTIFDKGLIYKGHKIVPYCPRCGTALSSHEVAQGYKDIEEKSAIAKFKVCNADKTYILAWTTTPWTLPSNVALCFNPEYEYVLIEAGDNGEKYILAKDLVEKHFEQYKILETHKGKHYEKLEYEPLFDFYKKEDKNCFYVTCNTYVTLSDGTGVVHIAPAFGEDDANVGREYDLPFVQMVGTDDKLILKQLKAENKLFKELMYAHSYPFCWRCDTPLLYYARSAWFIKMSELKDKLLKNNDTINWIPDNIKKGRMGNFLENVIDWGISRERYWGTPLPLWVCDCGHIKAVGSKEELKKLGNIKGDIELHKPYVDSVTIKCDCGCDMKRTPEVIDCWYDSGSMPFAQYHYPFENKEVFEKTFPADFISEAVDQTRGWFYTLLAISTLLFDKAPFSNCIVLGHVNDKNGLKMSKHKGNVVDPWTVLDVQGADAVRWYFYTGSAPWLPSRFYADAVSEAQRKFLGTLWNTYSFYVLYAEIDKFDPTKYNFDKCKFSAMDKWVLSALNSLVDYVDNCLNTYKITESARAIQDFTDKLSNWYVRRCRERYWSGGMDDDKTAAYMTLYKVLETLSRLSAPFTPFIAESIYQNIVKSVDNSAPLSVHLTDFPLVEKRFIDKKLEQDMDVAIAAAELARACRNAANIKNRQPLQKLIISGEKVSEITQDLKDIIADELNIKTIEIQRDVSQFVTYEVKPQLKTLGPKYGAKLGIIRTHLSENGSVIANTVNGGEVYKFDAGGVEVELKLEDVLISIKDAGGFASQSGSGLIVVLDTTVTPELKTEGYMREIVSKVQAMRKDSDFEITDNIKIYYHGDDEIDRVFLAFADKIKADTLAKEIINKQCGQEKDINDYEVIATGSGEKLERWGDVILLRPDPQAIWKPQFDLASYKGLHAKYSRHSSGGGAWKVQKKFPDSWNIAYEDFVFEIKPMGFKHTGLFPEQAVNWDQMTSLIKNAGRQIKVLNLFAYTGGATVACAKAGAHVTHVDAAKGMVERAKVNCELSKVSNNNVRYIIDDCVKFVGREIKRGVLYDAIIMDPPSYGRGPGGEVWKIEDSIYDLVMLTKGVLSDNPLFYLINSYTTGLQASVIDNIVSIAMSEFGGTHSGYEVLLPTSEKGIVLPCGNSALWQAEKEKNNTLGHSTDNHVLVVVKPQNIPTQADSSGDKDLLTMLKEYRKTKENKPGEAFVGLVHRLDRPTGGVMVFAKTSKAAARLSDQITSGDFDKRYFAVTVGTPKIPQARISDYLVKDEANNIVTRVPAKIEGAKKAELDYKVLQNTSQIALVDIDLITGRSHQARVQMAGLGTPIFGDAKYGGDSLAKGHKLALWAYRLSFLHPTTKESLVFKVFPPTDEVPWKHFAIEKFMNVAKPE